jgi:hypothetical protein
MNIDGVCNITEFEVIDIMDYSQSYPSLMGLEWDFYTQAITNLKIMDMIFRVGDLKVTTPLDPSEGKV